MKSVSILWSMLAAAIFIWAMLLIISEYTNRWQASAISEQLQKEYSAAETSDDKFSSMLRINPDFFAWLNVGELSTPVVKGSDNKKYLNTDFYGNEDTRGTIFADYRNSLAGGLEPIILYGHNFTSSGEMFAVVEKLMDINFLSAHPFLELELKNGTKKYYIHTLFKTDADSNSSDFFDYTNLPFSDDTKAIEKLISEINRRTFIKDSTSLTPKDTILILSTCGYDYADERIVAVAKLMDDKNYTPTYTAVENPYKTEKWRRLYGR